MIDVKSFIGCCQEKNKKRVITGQDSVILWYHREAEGKKTEASHPHTINTKGSLNIKRGSFCCLLSGNGILWKYIIVWWRENV